MRCKICKYKNENNARFCVNCGADLQNMKSGSLSWLPFAIAGGVLVAVALVVVLVVIKTDAGNSPESTAAVTAQKTAEGKDVLAVTSGKIDTSKKDEEPTNKVEDKSSAKTEDKTTTLSGNYPPRFTSADASSQLADQYYSGEGTFTYGPELVLDDNTQTAWNEGVDGPGIGQWIRVSADSPQLVYGVSLRNGYPRKEQTYYNNHRIKDCTIELSDGYKLTCTLQDSFNQWQDIAFDQGHDTRWIKITVDSVWGGQKYDDTCLSGVRAY